MALSYEVVLEMDETENGECCFLVTAPQLPEVTTFGETQEEAVRNGLDAIEEALAGRIAHNEEIPFPVENPPKKGHFVDLTATVFFKCSLYMICREQGITRAELQRKLGLPHREQVDRLFRLDQNTKLDTLAEALAAVGAGIEVKFPTPKAA
jgi:antitoxin HicB